MKAFIFRRLLATLGLMLVLLSLVFCMLRAIPGDPAIVLGGDYASPALLAQLRRTFGLDRPLIEQWSLFLGQLLQGNLGYAKNPRQPVAARLSAAFPITANLALTTIIYSTLLGIGLGGVAAYKANTWVDHSLRLAAILGISLPAFWLGLGLLRWFALELHWMPVSWDASWRNFILPTLTLGTGSAAGLSRLVRAALLEALSQPYIRTARAKGVRPFWVVARHAFRNAWLPLFTVLGLELASLLNGAVVVEHLFGLPGLGALTVEAFRQRDYALLQGAVLLAGVIYLSLNLLVDIGYALCDPRIRFAA